MWRSAGYREREERLRLLVGLPGIEAGDEREIGLKLVPERNEEDERVGAGQSGAERREEHQRDAHNRNWPSILAHSPASKESTAPALAANTTDKNERSTRRRPRV